MDPALDLEISVLSQVKFLAKHLCVTPYIGALYTEIITRPPAALLRYPRNNVHISDNQQVIRYLLNTSLYITMLHAMFQGNLLCVATRISV